MKEYTKDRLVEKLHGSTNLSNELLNKFTKGDLQTYFGRVASDWQVAAAQGVMYGGFGAAGASFAASGTAYAVFLALALIGTFASSYLKAGNRSAVEEITERAAAVSQDVPKLT